MKDEMSQLVEDTAAGIRKAVSSDVQKEWEDVFVFLCVKSDCWCSDREQCSFKCFDKKGSKAVC